MTNHNCSCKLHLNRVGSIQQTNLADSDFGEVFVFSRQSFEIYLEFEVDLQTVIAMAESVKGFGLNPIGDHRHVTVGENGVNADGMG